MRVDAYNDSDWYVCEWLRRLIDYGAVPPGAVLERDISDIAPRELSGFRRVHLYAGIGGWAEALRLAEFSGPAWTASCPCQPFSLAGRRRGYDDRRHLWPVTCDLIAEHVPAALFGEQVAGAAGWGWFSRVRSELEALGYAVCSAQLPACSVGAPHYRERLYFAAFAVGHPDLVAVVESAPAGADAGPAAQPRQWGGARAHGESGESAGQSGVRPWDGAEYALCMESGEGGGASLRRIRPGSFPLADGAGHGMAHLRSDDKRRLTAYGNAIVPQAAAVFVRAAAAAYADYAG